MANPIFDPITGEAIVPAYIRITFDPLKGVLERAQKELVGQMIRVAGDGRRRFYVCTRVERIDIEVNDGDFDGWGTTVAGLRYHLEGRKPLELAIDVEIEVLL